jgi:hypothetical protein
MTTYCKVRWCRFNSSHVTKGHKCGRCGVNGHGDAECYSDFQKQSLVRYHNEILPSDLHCTVEDCDNKQYHTIDAHHCPRCHIRTTHTIAECNNPISSSTSTSTSTSTSITSTYNNTSISLSSSVNNNSTQKSFDVKCPICRKHNHISKPTKLYGISDKCCICMENVIDTLMPSCGHCCICLTCLPTLDKF